VHYHFNLERKSAEAIDARNAFLRLVAAGPVSFDDTAATYSEEFARFLTELIEGSHIDEGSALRIARVVDWAAVVAWTAVVTLKSELRDQGDEDVDVSALLLRIEKALDGLAEKNEGETP
jgi:hypothetical protein